jgi:hypothetical protein
VEEESSMRHLSRLLAALLVLGLTSTASARVAVIQTTAQVSDHSENGLRQAVKDAVATAVRGALAMGLSQVALKGVTQLDAETVAVQVVASDTDAERDESPGSPDADAPSTDKQEL